MTRIETGARMLRVGLKSHQNELGEVLDAGEETNAIQWPRRSGKTTAVWCWLLGRCEDEDETQIVVTAQTGVKARDRFLSMMRVLERHYPEDAGGPHVFKGAGHESFDFANGSRLWVVAPKPESVRGDAADVVYVDEPQELDPQASLDLQQAVMPLLDTVENGQIVLSGTPGTDRSGWYWEALEAAKSGKAGHVGSIHAANEGDDIEDEDVWRRVHPGIAAGMTKIETIRARRAGMSAQAFAMEYLGIWPGSSDARAIPEELWEAARAPMPTRPDRFGLAADVSPDGSTAALVAAWRDDDGLAWVALLESGTTRQVGQEAVRISRKYRLPVAVDAIGANLELLDGLKRAKPSPKITEHKHGDMATAASAFVSALREGELRHSGQAALDAAAEGAMWRETADSGRLFARRRSTADVTPVVAASEALLVFDRMPKAVSNRIITRTSA